MNEVQDRLDEHAVDAPVSLGVGLTSEYMPLDQHMLGKVAAQLADILETLKPKETHRASRALDIAQDSDGTTLRHAKTCGLSDRQVEILGGVAEGMSNKEIAAQLHVSDQTIKNHMTHILDKLYANDRTHAVVLAYRLGLLDLEAGTSRMARRERYCAA
ncbi:MAG: LuxR C-terminal-related transcriptional regulator [Chloroflexota bacterium]